MLFGGLGPQRAGDLAAVTRTAQGQQCEQSLLAERHGDGCTSNSKENPSEVAVALVSWGPRSSRK